MRRLLCILVALVSCMLLSTTVFAESTATKVDNMIYVATDGSCQVSMSVNIRLENSAKDLTFPLPADAKNVIMNGMSARTIKSGDVQLVDLSHLDGLMGEYTTTFQYNLSNAVHFEEPEKEGEERKMILQIPLLSGFAYPVDKLSFTITLPTDAVAEADFHSGYLKQTVESIMDVYPAGKIITGSVTKQLNDHETLYMTMYVTKDMFPGVGLLAREGNPEVIPMAILAVLALAYWGAALRTSPILRQKRSIPLEGVTAGEMGSRLTMAGGDLTMMVFTWAQLGYIHIHVGKRGKVLLYKRMEMGNERGPYENRCFKALFSRGDTVDATAAPYAKLCLKSARTVPGIQEMYRRSGAGSVKLFRGIACGVSLFGGICLAMNMTTMTVLQVLLSIVLAVVGAVTAWSIQEGAYRVHIRGKLPLYIATVFVVLWMVLGILAGQVLIALAAVLMQVLAGFLAAYGGRRSDLGRYSASEVLGLRHFLKHISNQELRRITDENPDYFFDMIPYAIAFGVDSRFAKAYGRIPLPVCPYLTAERKVNHTAEDWALFLRKVADQMDKRQRQMQLEKWLPVAIHKR